MIKIAIQTDKMVKDVFYATKIHHISKYSCEVGEAIEFWRGENQKINLKSFRFGKGEITNCVPIYINPYSESIIINGEDFKDYYFLNLIAHNEGYSFWDIMKYNFKKPFNGYLLFWSNKAKLNMRIAEDLFHEQPFDTKNII
jgi:hypothetical protein